MALTQSLAKTLPRSRLLTTTKYFSPSVYSISTFHQLYRWHSNPRNQEFDYRSNNNNNNSHTWRRSITIGAVAATLGSIQLASCTADTIKENALEQIKLMCKNYINSPKYVYKLCNPHGIKSNDEYIVVLEKLPSTVTNEERDSVYDARYAKFRGSEFKVVAIINTDNPKQIIRSATNRRKTTYTINEIVVPDMFDTDMDLICTTGIHYFKTIDAAFFYRTAPPRYTGLWYNWNSNGILESTLLYMNGVQTRCKYPTAPKCCKGSK